jgi:outer membrane lipoprotein SlyB
MAETPLEPGPEVIAEDLVVDDVIEDGLVAGRPVEDRSFEVVEVATGASLGVAIGAVVGGPIGAAAGGIIGGVAGFIAGESIEHAVGRAAETTDATESDAAANA